jgi:hypothetical protein
VLAGSLVAACGSTVQLAGTTTGEPGVLGGVDTPGAGFTSATTTGAGSTDATTGPPVGGATTGSTSGASFGKASPRAGGGATGGFASPSRPAPGGPLRFGLLDVSSTNTALGAIGSSVSTTTNGQQLARAFVRFYNEHGGIAGRRLEPVEYTVNATDSNYESSVSAACARFTQDNRLRIVMTQLGNVFSHNYEECLSKAGVTDVNLATAIPDDKTMRRFPGYYNIAVPTVDRRARAMLKGFRQGGVFTARSKIGLLVEGCPENLVAYERTVEPLVSELGLDVQRRDVSCFRGFGQVGSWLAEVQSSVLPFRSGGVDRVMFLSAWESLALTGFEGQASSQGYQPHYGLSTNAGAGVFASTYSSSQNARMHGVGWIPIFDTTGIPQNATTRKCMAMARSQGINATSQTDVSLVYQVCEQFLLFERVIVGAAGRDDPASLRAGLARVANGYLSALQVGGTLHLSSTVHDATEKFALFGFSAGCGCFRYTSKPQALA